MSKLQISFANSLLIQKLRAVKQYPANLTLF